MVLRLIATIMAVTIGLTAGFLTSVPVDMQDTQVDDYEFFFYEDLKDQFGQLLDVSNRTVGFVLTDRVRQWEPGITKTIHLEDNRPPLSIYETCWHEVEHWRLGIEKQLSEEQEHDIIHNTPFWERNSAVCARMMVQGFDGFQL